MVRSMFRSFGVVVMGGFLLQPATLGAQTGTQSLGSVNVSRRVMANGQVLAPGTYTLRLLPDPVGPVIGQTPSESRWVEFVRGGKVMGKEVATVIAATDAKTVLRGKGPASGSAKSEILKGDDYLRIWVNRGGTHYLVHLAVAKS